MNYQFIQVSVDKLTQKLFTFYRSGLSVEYIALSMFHNEITFHSAVELLDVTSPQASTTNLKENIDGPY